MGVCQSRARPKRARPHGRTGVIDGEYFAYSSGSGPWFKCAPDSEMEPRVSAKGVAGPDMCAPATVPQMLTSAAMQKGDQEAMKIERPVPPLPADGKNPPKALPDDQWTTWTYRSMLEDVRAVAKGFVKLGFSQYDSVNIWGFNSPEWVLAALAANFAGGKVAGLYPTDTGDTAAYKVVHSGGSIVVLEERGKIKKLVDALQARGDARRVKALVAWGFKPEPGETVDVAGCGAVPLLSFEDLVQMGKAESDEEIDRRVLATKPGHCAGLIYTSGTTGDPKAVMISHDNIIFETAAVCQLLSESTGLGNTFRQERLLSYLPMSHVAGMMVDVIVPMIVTARMKAWVTVYFARNYDLKAGTIKDRLNAARPTMFLGVPLVWEKIADKIRAIGAANTGVKKALGDKAKVIALQHSRSLQYGEVIEGSPGLCLALGLLGKVKQSLGLDQCKFGFTGAAPIRVDTLEYFSSLGLQINEVYGMSECTGAATWSIEEMHQWGSCGFELPGVEVRSFIVDPNDFHKKTEVPLAPSLTDLDERYQGELCFRGRNIMMGYLANPDLGEEHVREIEKKTAETIDNDGWLHSGDKGMITKDGMVKITGRYKELIIGEGGENIAPVPIEDHVKKSCDGIAEVMMIGDKRKYNVAIVTLKAVGANGEVPGTDDLDAGAKRVNPEVSTISGAIKDPVWIEAVTAAITSANNNSKVCPNNAFKIQKFTILPTNFSEENSELTPTKKLKRKNVETAYAATVDALYTSKEKVYVPYVAGK